MKSQKILVALMVVILLVNVAVGGVLIWEAKKQTKLAQAQIHIKNIEIWNQHDKSYIFTKSTETMNTLVKQGLYDPKEFN